MTDRRPASSFQEASIYSSNLTPGFLYRLCPGRNGCRTLRTPLGERGHSPPSSMFAPVTHTVSASAAV